MARLPAHDSSDVAASGVVFGEHDVARPEATNRAVANFDLDLTGEGNDILPVGRWMVSAVVIGRCGAEHNAMCRLKCRSHHVLDRFHFNFQVFKVRFAVAAGVKSDNLHVPCFRRNGPEKQPILRANLFKWFKPFNRFAPFKPSEKSLCECSAHDL
jgi:hypothetical protein